MGQKKTLTQIFKKTTKLICGTMEHSIRDYYIYSNALVKNREQMRGRREEKMENIVDRDAVEKQMELGEGEVENGREELLEKTENY